MARFFRNLISVTNNPNREIKIVFLQFHLYMLPGILQCIIKQIAHNLSYCFFIYCRPYFLFSQFQNQFFVIQIESYFKTSYDSFQKCRNVNTFKFHGKLVGTYLLEIEKLSCQFQQPLRILYYYINILLLFRFRKILLLNSLKRTINQRQRSTYFMSYLRKEINLRFIQFLFFLYFKKFLTFFHLPLLTMLVP